MYNDEAVNLEEEEVYRDLSVVYYMKYGGLRDK